METIVSNKEKATVQIQYVLDKIKEIVWIHESNEGLATNVRDGHIYRFPINLLDMSKFDFLSGIDMAFTTTKAIVRAQPAGVSETSKDTLINLVVDLFSFIADEKTSDSLVSKYGEKITVFLPLIAIVNGLRELQKTTDVVFGDQITVTDFGTHTGEFLVLYAEVSVRSMIEMIHGHLKDWYLTMGLEGGLKRGELVTICSGRKRPTVQVAGIKTVLFDPTTDTSGLILCRDVKESLQSGVSAKAEKATLGNVELYVCSKCHAFLMSNFDLNKVT